MSLHSIWADKKPQLFGTFTGGLLVATAGGLLAHYKITSGMPVWGAALSGFAIGVAVSLMIWLLSQSCCRRSLRGSAISYERLHPVHEEKESQDTLEQVFYDAFQPLFDNGDLGFSNAPLVRAVLWEGLRRRVGEDASARVSVAAELGAARNKFDDAGRQDAITFDELFEAIASICRVLLVKIMHADAQCNKYTCEDWEKPFSSNTQSSSYFPRAQQPSPRLREDAPPIIEINRESYQLIMVNHVNPYQVLGISPSATNKEIETAYKKKMREVHPDKGGSQANAQLVVQSHLVLATDRVGADQFLNNGGGRMLAATH